MACLLYRVSFIETENDMFQVILFCSFNDELRHDERRLREKQREQVQTCTSAYNWERNTEPGTPGLK